MSLKLPRLAVCWTKSYEFFAFKSKHSKQVGPTSESNSIFKCMLSPKILGLKNFGSKKFFGPKKFWVRKNFKSQNIVGPKNLGQKISHDFTAMFQASSFYKSYKWKYRAAYYGNFSSPVRLTCNYNAISVQLQMQSSTETELGKK